MSEPQKPESELLPGGADASVFSEGLDRRRLIKIGSLTAGAALLTPTLLTLGASPASASGTPAYNFASTANTNAKTLPVSVSGAGLWVVGMIVRGNTYNSTTEPVTFTNPSGWTSLFTQYGTDSSGAADTRITMKAWVKVATTNEGNINFGFTGGQSAANHRAIAAFQFPTATEALPVSTSAVGTFSTSSVTAARPGTSFLYFAGAVGSGNPTISPDNLDLTSANAVLDYWDGNASQKATIGVGIFNSFNPDNFNLFGSGGQSGALDLAVTTGTVNTSAAFLCAIS